MVLELKHGEAIALGLADGMPWGLIEDIADWLDNNRKVCIDVHYMHATSAILPLEEAARRRQVRLFCYFMGAADRKLLNRGIDLFFIPAAFRDVGSLMLKAGVRKLFVAGSEYHGALSWGSCCGYSAQLAEHKGVKVYFEINDQLPFVAGRFMYSDYEDVELSFTCQPIEMHKIVKPTEVDKAIAAHIVNLLPENPSIQVGVGGIPNSVLATMVDRKIRVKSIVSELFTPSMIPLIEQGLLDEYAVCTIAFGNNQEFYNFLDDNDEVFLDGVEITNSSETLAKIPNLVSINSCLEVDWTGQVNSEQINRRTYSGAGGQLDFVLGALRSPGGMSFLCMPSKRIDKGTGEIRHRIVDRLHGVVTVPRNCVDWIVTENGAVNLRGLSEDERCNALIGIS